MFPPDEARAEVALYALLTAGTSAAPDATCGSSVCSPAEREGTEGMLAATLYDWLKFFHILMAIVWAGGALGIQLMAVRLIRTSDPYALRAFSGAVEWIGNRVFLPASVILLGLGIWMVVLEPAWTFAQFWVLAAFAMFGYSILSGARFTWGRRAGSSRRCTTPKDRTRPVLPR